MEQAATAGPSDCRLERVIQLLRPDDFLDSHVLEPTHIVCFPLRHKNQRLEREASLERGESFEGHLVVKPFDYDDGTLGDAG